MENSLSDIWSILDFCYEGYLGTFESFKNKFMNDYDFIDLEPVIKPLILKRKVKEV